MAALEASPFEDLLASHSVFVSPLAHVANRYGHQAGEGPYDFGEDTRKTESQEPCNLGGNPQWGWTGRPDPTAAMDHFEEEYVDFDDDVVQEPTQQQDHGAASPERPSKEDVRFDWEELGGGREEDVQGGNGSARDGEEASVRFDEVDSISSNNHSNNTYSNKDYRETTEECRGRTTGGEKKDEAGDANNIDQRDSPLPVVHTEASSPGSRSFEDQPIRGLAPGREMSLDELIAQGERQMKEAQDRTAAATATRRAPVVGGGVDRDSVKSTTTAVRQGNIISLATPGIVKHRSTGDTVVGETDDAHVQPSGHRVLNNLEFRDASPGAGRKQRFPPTAESTANRGGDSVRGEGGGVTELFGNASVRNASFATSWSGGDADPQLRYLSSLSMGVTPADGTGDPSERREAESRSERERREFYELEIELLREEERAVGIGHLAGQRDDPEGQDPEEDVDFWDDVRKSNELGGEQERVGRGGLADGLRFGPVVTSEQGRRLRGRESDEAHSGCVGRYQQGIGEAEAVDVINTVAEFSRGSRQGEALDNGQQSERITLVDRNGGGGEDRRQKAVDPVNHHGPTRYSEDSDYDDYHEDDDTRRWEAGDCDDHEAESRWQGGWGQSARQNGSKMARDPPPHDNQPPAGQDDRHSRVEALTVSGRQEPSHSANPPARQTPIMASPDPSLPLPRPNARVEVDAFKDNQAWGEGDLKVAQNNPDPTARFDRSHGTDHHGTGPPAQWSRPRPHSPGPTHQRDEGLHSVPSQSKLVQRVFGVRGRGARGARASDRGRNGGGGRGGRGPRGSQSGGGVETWAVQAELEGKLRELEEEIARYKEENERARLSRRKQESVLAEVMRKRQEVRGLRETRTVREWAEAERAAVETWCAEQRQAATREKRAAMKQIQGLRARAQAGGASGAGTATERRQRQEIEALKATVERAKLDAEAARKKARASERRLQQQIKSGAERIAELEGQVSFLERQRVDVWANSTASGGALGAGRRPQKQGGKVASSVSADRNSAGVGRRSQEAFVGTVNDGENERGRANSSTCFSSKREGHDDEGEDKDDQSCGDDRSVTTRRRGGEQEREGSFLRNRGEIIAGEGHDRNIAGAADERGRGDVGRRQERVWHSEESGWTSADGEQDPAVARRSSPDASVCQQRWGPGSDTDADKLRFREEGYVSGIANGRWHAGAEWPEGRGYHDGGRPDSQTDPRLGAAMRATASSAAVAQGGRQYEDVEGFSPSGGRGRRSPSLLAPPQFSGGDNCNRGFPGDTLDTRSENGELLEASAGLGLRARELSCDGQRKSWGGVRYDPMRYETPVGSIQRGSSDSDPRTTQAHAVGGRRESSRRPVRSTSDQATLPRSPGSDTGRVVLGWGHSRARERHAADLARREFDGVGRHQPPQLSPAGRLDAEGSAAGRRLRRDPRHPIAGGATSAAQVGEVGAPLGGGGRRDARGSLGTSEGGKVEHILRDGRKIVLFSNGTQKESLPDGGCVVRFTNGDLKRVEGRTKIVVYTYAAARTTHTMHPSGLEVFEFPNGQVERHHKSGEKEIDFPDGTRKAILPCGREMSEFPDGVTVVEYPEGYRDVISPGGTSHRELPDGTVASLPGSPEKVRGSAGSVSRRNGGGSWSETRSFSAREARAGERDSRVGKAA